MGHEFIGHGFIIGPEFIILPEFFIVHGSSETFNAQFGVLRHWLHAFIDFLKNSPK